MNLMPKLKKEFTVFSRLLLVPPISFFADKRKAKLYSVFFPLASMLSAQETPFLAFSCDFRRSCDIIARMCWVLVFSRAVKECSLIFITFDRAIRLS